MMKNQYVHRGKEEAEVFLHNFISLIDHDDPLFMIAGNYSYELSGVLDYFSSLFDKKRCVRFSEFSTNPSINDLRLALGAFKNSNAKLIISVGGGSAIDLAKLVNYFAAVNIEPEEYLKNKETFNISTLPLLAIPTTAGTGSEATHFATLYIGSKKISVSNRHILPSHVWLNFEFTFSLSRYQTACTGFDALAQAIESYWAISSTHQSKQNSEKAIQLCMQHLEGAVLTPTVENRAGMLEAAYLSGKAINISKTTAAHALSYSLTAHYGLPHGHAVALTLPAIFEANAATTDNDLNDPRGIAYVHTIIRDLCKLLGVDSPTKATQRIKMLMAIIGLSDMWLSDHGFDRFEAHDIVIKGVDLERLANNPRRLNRMLIEKIAASIW
jgi:alcohol dehydrogenase class IV